MKGQSKYKNKKTLYDGIKFDSKSEAERYKELKLLESAGQIKDLELQPKFTLIEGFMKNNVKFNPIKYKADFKYYDNLTQRVVIEDVKGMETKEFKLKHKMFEDKYRDLTLTIVR